jgi:Ser/Thr protein kinase RdoA (MazF antagonist)
VRGTEVFYLRVAEEADESLAVDAELHRELRRLGVKVPSVVYCEPFDAAIGRSILITTAIPGTALSQVGSLPLAASVAREAGHDLGILNQVVVRGFGWVRRDGAAWPLQAELTSYPEFVKSYLPADWPGPLAGVFRGRELRAIERMLAAEERRRPAHGLLAHGDFDVSAIFHENGRYTGIIDFGEIRGTELTFDLGHFYLHDGEIVGWALVDQLIQGYQEVVELPADFEDEIATSAILLGLRQLCRWIGPERGAALDDPSVGVRVRRIAELIEKRRYQM